MKRRVLFMKIDEVIFESIEINVSRLVDIGDGQQAASAVGSVQRVKCRICNGDGKNTYPDRETGGTYTEECGLCYGSGVERRFVDDGPSLQMSNHNAIELLRHLGIHDEGEYTGRVTEEHLPELRKRLIRMLNSEKDQSAMTKDTTTSQGAVRKQGTDGNVTSIGRGPKMIDVGRTPEQVKRYAKVMLDIVEYAMKHGYFISWG